MALAADPFKGQRNLSLRNDFNQQSPETARIATVSQQIALGRGPNSIFPGDRKPPIMLRWGWEGCGATSQPKTNIHITCVVKS
jgi:hypothetical protein